MLPILGVLLPVLVPPLVKIAESKFGAKNGETKKQWVTDFLSDVWDICEMRVPGWKWFRSAKEGVIAFAGGYIDRVVDRLKKKGKL